MYAHTQRHTHSYTHLHVKFLILDQDTFEVEIVQDNAVKFHCNFFSVCHFPPLFLTTAVSLIIPKQHWRRPRQKWHHSPSFDRSVPRTVDPPLYHVCYHLPHQCGWKPGNGRTAFLGLSPAHVYALFLQWPFSGELWLLLSCHSHSNGWVTRWRQGRLLQCTRRPNVLFCSLCECGTSPFGLSGLWASSTHNTSTMTTHVCACLTTGSYVCGFMNASFHVEDTFRTSLCKSNTVHHFVMFQLSWLSLALTNTFVKWFLLSSWALMSLLLFWLYWFPIY